MSLSHQLRSTFDVREIDVDHGMTEIGAEHGGQIGADLHIGIAEVGHLCDAPAAEASAIDVEVPPTGPSLDAHHETSEGAAEALLVCKRVQLRFVTGDVNSFLKTRRGHVG